MTTMITEGRVAEVDLIMQELADGTRDIRDTMNNPQTPEEQYAAHALHRMYDEIAATHRLHPDDDFEKIEDIMADWIAKDYGVKESMKMSKEKQALLESVRKIAGLPLTEWDDDDDEDVKIAMKDKKQAEFEAKNKKTIAKVNADKDMERVAKGAKKEDDDEDEKPAAKPSPAATPVAKKEKKPAAEDKKPAGRGSVATVIRSVLAKNKSAKASDVRAALEKAGVAVPAHLHSHIVRLRKKLTEGYILVHPQMASFVLAENMAMNQYQWISVKDESTSLEPVVFENQDAAKKVMQYLYDYKNQQSVLVPLALEE
jgi:hypothetical protein